MRSDASDLDDEDRNSMQLAKSCRNQSSWNKNQVKSIKNHHSSDSDASIFGAEDSNWEQASDEFDDQSNGDHDSNEESVDPKASGSKAKLSKQPKQNVAGPINSSKNCSFCHKFFKLKSSQIHNQKHYCSKKPNKKLGICHFCNKTVANIHQHKHYFCPKNPNAKLETPMTNQKNSATKAIKKT